MMMMGKPPSDPQGRPPEAGAAGVPGALYRRARQPMALVVEDDGPFRFTLTEMLAERGYLCLEASSGVEGMMQFLEHKGQVTLAIVDLILPRGILGHEVCRFIRSATVGAPRRPAIIAMTGDVQMMDRASCIRAGVQQVLRKPFLDAELGAAINRARAEK